MPRGSKATRSADTRPLRKPEQRADGLIGVFATLAEQHTEAAALFDQIQG
jgi:hypothetical protein